MGACCYYDVELPEFYHEEWITARKEHSCCECGTKIQKGVVYQRITGKWDGRIDTFKTCEKCADLRDSLDQVWCTTFRGLDEAYSEYLEYIGSPPRSLR